MNQVSQGEASLAILLRALRLPSFVEYHEEVAAKAEHEGWTFLQYLRHLVELEINDRQRRRVERLQKGSGLPAEKTLATLNQNRLPTKVRRQLASLIGGSFLEHAVNVLAFGLPGRGKTHLLSAIGHELVQRGYRVLFVAAFSLVQRLLLAKRDLTLERELKRLDAYDAVILDDIGYIQQDREEMEVLFTFLSERYERRSVMITSNLVFSQWDRIFKDAMTTAAAIDRVVHHAIILELTGPSKRWEDAECNNEAEKQKDAKKKTKRPDEAEESPPPDATS
jgi:DNA replication protein DnaC